MIPSEKTERRSSAPPEKVFPLLDDFHHWAQWSPWEKLDPALQRSYSGPEKGVGAVYDWTGNNKVGTGRMEILESTPERVVATMRVRPGASLRSREARLASATPDDNRASLGCVGVPGAFYDTVVQPLALPGHAATLPLHRVLLHTVAAIPGSTDDWLQRLPRSQEAALILVIGCLLGPEWVEPIKRQQNARVAVLLDSSRSMGAGTPADSHWSRRSRSRRSRRSSTPTGSCPSQRARRSALKSSVGSGSPTMKPKVTSS